MPQSDPHLAALRQMAASNPTSPEALARLGAALRELGEDAEAEACCRRALALQPWDPTALFTLGGLMQMQGRFDEALALADAAIALRPQSGEAWIVRGDSFANSGRPSEAVTAYLEAAGAPSTAFQANVRLGKLEGVLGHVNEALAAFDRAIALEPSKGQAIYERALLRLQTRAFADGWKDYEARWRWDRFIVTSSGYLPAPMVPHLTLAPSAADLLGKRVLLIGEQGIGDQLMFASMLPDLANVATSVLCLPDPRLIRLLSASMPGITFMNPSGAQVDGDTFDLMLAIGSLGSAFRPRVEDFPGTRFVRPRPEVTGCWAERLGPRRKRLRVGLSWRGGLPITNRIGRSIDLARLTPILDRGDCEFVSLQYGDVAAELAHVNAGRPEPIRAFPAADLYDFEDFAGLIENLDVVVSVQNATVHLAGALGKRCLALLPHTAEWRYMREGPTMPWYGSVRLLRQRWPGDWTSVIGEAAEALGEVQGASSEPVNPASKG